MRLIDADHLHKWIIANWHSGWHHKTVDDILDQIDREDTYIEDADIVDAEPIIHGHWIKVEILHSPSKQNVYKCSECDTHLFAIVDGYRYCPNCGAKMDNTIINNINDDIKTSDDEIIRCKDCKFWGTEQDGYCAAIDDPYMLETDAEDFCSWGEKK